MPRRPSNLPLVTALLAVAGCSSSLEQIDEQVASLLGDTSLEMNEQHTADYVVPEIATRGRFGSRSSSWTDDQAATLNPAAGDLPFVLEPEQEAAQVLERIRAHGEVPPDTMEMALAAALAYAVDHSREFRFQTEEYVLTALRLLAQRHLWGPQFFNDVSATVRGDATDGTYDVALDLVNELGVTQRLPYGGTVSARALARATEDLHQKVAGEGVQDAEIILAADVPLLRGAGQVARESRIQAERDLIYAARTFARFRREFLFDIARDFLNIVVQMRQIENGRVGVASFEQVEQEQVALYSAGRSTPFDAAEAKNSTLDAIDQLNGDVERYRLALDLFKVRLGMPVEQPLVIVPDELSLEPPDVDMNGAVVAALDYRLDLQSRRDQVEDARRGIENAENALLSDLRVRASYTLPTDPSKDRSGLQFDPNDAEFDASVTWGLPLDRELERLALREAQIDFERSKRNYQRFRDEIALAVRGAVRGIDSALFSLRIQEQNVEIAERRQASIVADPARADIRQKTQAIEQVLRARDNRDGARRDLEIAVLRYLLDSGQLRVDARGETEPLDGMELRDGG
ncbi:MAG: TolC family protein [Planctomycetes bacterium]|nr:TolC family protein [Planctomycetota bacterium]